MEMILAASNLPCHKCRELTCSLIKSVDAFEILVSGNAAIPSEILISTIRQIVAKTLTKEDKDEEPEGKNVDTITNSNTNVNTHLHVISSCSLNVDVPVENQKLHKEMSIPTPAFDDVLDCGENPDDRTMETECTDKRVVKRPGRGKRGRKRKRIGMPKRPITQRRRRYKSLSLQDSDEEEGTSEDISDGGPDKNPNCRTLSTHQDYERAAQYMKKIQMETQDGFFYNLFECITCTRQFSQSQNLRRHIVSLHFNKKVISIGKATRHMVKYNSRDERRMTKVRLYANADSLTRKSSSNFCLVPTNPIPEQNPRGRNGKILPTIHTQLQNQSQSQYHDIKLLSKYNLPPDFTVRNPCKNFDLEKTLSAHVSLTSNPKLFNVSMSNISTSVAIKTIEEYDKKPFKEELSDDDEVKPSSFLVPMDTTTSRYNSLVSSPSSSSPPKLDYYPRINYDKIDLIEMDVDTIMAIDF